MIKPYSPKLTKNQHFIPQMYLRNFSFNFNNKKEEAEIYFLMKENITSFSKLKMEDKNFVENICYGNYIYTTLDEYSTILELLKTSFNSNVNCYRNKLTSYFKSLSYSQYKEIFNLYNTEIKEKRKNFFREKLKNVSLETAVRLHSDFSSKDFIKITYNGNISDFLNEYEKQSVNSAMLKVKELYLNMYTNTFNNLNLKIENLNKTFPKKNENLDMLKNSISSFNSIIKEMVDEVNELKNRLEKLKNEKLPFKLTTFQQEICDRLSILNYDGLNKISTNFIDILLELIEKEYKKCKKIEKTFLENILADYENTASNFINIISSKSQIDENTKYELIKYIAIQYFRLQKNSLKIIEKIRKVRSYKEFIRLEIPKILKSDYIIFKISSPLFCTSDNPICVLDSNFLLFPLTPYIVCITSYKYNKKLETNIFILDEIKENLFIKYVNFLSVNNAKSLVLSFNDEMDIIKIKTEEFKSLFCNLLNK